MTWQMKITETGGWRKTVHPGGGRPAREIRGPSRVICCCLLECDRREEDVLRIADEICCMHGLGMVQPARGNPGWKCVGPGRYVSRWKLDYNGENGPRYSATVRIRDVRVAYLDGGGLA